MPLLSLINSYQSKIKNFQQIGCEIEKQSATENDEVVCGCRMQFVQSSYARKTVTSLYAIVQNQQQYLSQDGKVSSYFPYNSFPIVYTPLNISVQPRSDPIVLSLPSPFSLQLQHTWQSPPLGHFQYISHQPLFQPSILSHTVKPLFSSQPSPSIMFIPANDVVPPIEMG